MLYEIKNKFTGEVIYSTESVSLNDCVVQAVKSRADLYGANLYGANLYGASLHEANLCGADLRGANLRGANLYGVTINWQSHDLLAEVLRQQASTVQQRMVAGLILISKNWCWKQFLAVDSIDQELRQWALKIFASYIKDGDNAPEELLSEINKA
jgi:hypothetical protein